MSESSTNRDEHFRKLENMYADAPCNAHFAPRLTVSEGTAEVVLAVREDFYHAAGAVHGSVYFKALDDAAFFSASSLVRDAFVVTASFQLYFLRPVTSGEMRAVGRVVDQTRNRLIAEAVLTDSDGREIARGSGAFMKTKQPLDERLGYR